MSGDKLRGCMWVFFGTSLVLFLSGLLVFGPQIFNLREMDMEVIHTTADVPVVDQSSDTPIPPATALPSRTLEPSVTPEIITVTLTSTDKPTATVTATATVTPTPTVTMTVTPTLTPLPLVDGPMIIGYSVENRPLEVYRFGTGDLVYLVMGGIHGGYEVNTVELMDQLIKYFTAHPGEVPPETRLYILRSMNMDGLQKPYDADGRANANKVDLNRNFPADWAEDWDRTGCWDYREINAGTHAASEPETIAVMAFILEHTPVAMVSYHAAAPGFYPSGNPHHKDSAALAKYLSKASGYPYPAVEMVCQMTGNLVDWAHTLGVAGADLELTDHYDTEYERNLKLVKSLLLWRP